MPSWARVSSAGRPFRNNRAQGPAEGLVRQVEQHRIKLAVKRAREGPQLQRDQTPKDSILLDQIG
jgi:hypothetical protein